MQHNSQINWLAILRGLTIVLVLTYHVRLLDTSTGECYQWILEIGKAFKAFRMPTFVMISGALLYYTRISKNWSTISLYKDKIIRIGLPLVFCTCIGNLMQLIFNGYVKTPKEVTLPLFFKSYVESSSTPWPHRWYLMVLILMMTLYPLYRYILRNKTLALMMLLVLFILEQFDISSMVETNWFCLFSLNKYLPYFFLGMVIFRYQWYRNLDRWYLALPLWIVYYLLLKNECENNIIGTLIGSTAMVSTAMLADRLMPTLCSSFRQYIFQIYLFGIVFQSFVELILWRRLAGCPDNFVVLFWCLSMLSGIYMPVLLSKFVEKIPYRPIRLCFGLK